jgi:ubiquinone biosynthesis protein
MVADGLTFFLQHLSPPRRDEVFRAQVELPADVDLPRRLVVFLHACPALHKIGQVVARHRELDLELRRHLQELESLEPDTPYDQLHPIIARELAPAAQKYRIRVAEHHLAEGSVAVVVPLTWSEPDDGAAAPRRHGVAKLLKPGVKERLGEDLDILARLAGYLEERWAAYGLPPLAYRDILTEVAALLTNEVELQHEQIHLRQARNQLAGQSDVLVPQLLPFCTGAMTAMERVCGRKVTDPRTAGSWRRPALFRAAVRALLTSVLFSRDKSVLFHGDPHAGNLLATIDGRLAILDWSLAGQLTADDRAQMSQILLGGLARDAGRVVGAISGLARGGAGQGLISSHVAAALAERRWDKPAGPAWAIELLDTLVRAGVRFPPRLLLFRKAFLTIQGVLADLYPSWSLEAALMTEGMVQFAWDWPMRWLKTPDDRDYASHVSNADLVHICCRAWMAQLGDA